MERGQQIAENLMMVESITPSRKNVLNTIICLFFRAYYFTSEEIRDLFSAVGFDCLDCLYVHRRTTNIKEGVDAGRVFLQAKFIYRGKGSTEQ